MQRVILDTSSIIFAFSMKADIFRAAEDQLHARILISRGVMRELGGIAAGKTKEGRAARVALEMIKRYSVEVADDNRSADAWILDEGMEEGLYVCTNDIRLKRALKDRGKRALSVSENGVLR
jgi:rRNA-processing protein FCF1